MQAVFYFQNQLSLSASQLDIFTQYCMEAGEYAKLT
jgi:hypothetical protein